MRSNHKRPGWTKEGTNDELGHGEVASVCDCNRLEPLPDESRSFRFHQGPEAPNALVGSHSTCIRAEPDLPLVLLPNLLPVLSEMECRLKFVQSDGVSTHCLCQRGDVRICRP